MPIRFLSALSDDRQLRGIDQRHRSNRRGASRSASTLFERNEVWACKVGSVRARPIRHAVSVSFAGVPLLECRPWLPARSVKKTLWPLADVPSCSWRQVTISCRSVNLTRSCGSLFREPRPRDIDLLRALARTRRRSILVNPSDLRSLARLRRFGLIEILRESRIDHRGRFQRRGSSITITQAGRDLLGRHEE